jgi:hypothetical protein
MASRKWTHRQRGIVRQWMRQRWSTNSVRRKISTSLRRHWRRHPARRRIAADHTRRQWARMRRRLCAAMRRRWQDPAYVARMAAISRARWQDPRYRPLMMANAKRSSQWRVSEGAKHLHALLGDGWHLEYWTPQGFVDVAHPTKRIAIEVDDLGHRRTKQQLRDRIKARGLRRSGWTLYRIPESHARTVRL